MIRGKDTFDVFVRDWWRPADKGEAGWPDGRVPYPGAPKRYMARGVNEQEARDLCAKYRAAHEPGLMSRKAEYERA